MWKPGPIVNFGGWEYRMETERVIEALLELAEYQRAEIAELQATCEELQIDRIASKQRLDGLGEFPRRI